MAIIRTLYVSRPLINAADLIAWAKGAGFPTALAPEKMHVTLAFSRAMLEWDEDDAEGGTLRVPAGIGMRSVQAMGDGGAVVLRFESAALAERWQALCDAGAKWDHDGFKPHVTITWDAPADLDLATLEPYEGALIFGPEVFTELNEGWKATIVEKSRTPMAKQRDVTKYEVVKVDKALGLVFGFAIICKVDGEDYYDLHDEHIPEDEMLKAVAEFAQSPRIAGDMHGRDKYNEPIPAGTVPLMFPLTTDIAKALGITTKMTGMLCALKPADPKVIEKYASGEYTGFSIGAWADDGAE